MINKQTIEKNFSSYLLILRSVDPFIILAYMIYIKRILRYYFKIFKSHFETFAYQTLDHFFGTKVDVVHTKCF